MMTNEELAAIEALRTGYVNACELERKALAIRVENNRGMKFRNAALGKAHAALNDAGVALARASSAALPRLLADAREAETLRTERDAMRAQRDAILRVAREIYLDGDRVCEFAAMSVCGDTNCIKCDMDTALEAALEAAR